MSLCLATPAETAMSADMVVYAGDNDMLNHKHYHARTTDLLHSRKSDQLCVRVVIHAQLRRLFRDGAVQERLRPFLAPPLHTATHDSNKDSAHEDELQQLLKSAKLRSQFFSRKQQELQRAIMASEEQQRLKAAHGLLASWERENAVLLRHPMFMSYIPSHALLLESAATVALYKRYARLAEGGYSSSSEEEEEEDEKDANVQDRSDSLLVAPSDKDTAAAMMDALHRLSGKPVPAPGTDVQTTLTLFTESTRPFRVDVHNKMFSQEVLQNKRVEYEQMRENVARLRQNLERCEAMHTLRSFMDLRDELFCEFGLDKLFALCVHRDAELSEVYEGSYAAHVAAGSMTHSASAVAVATATHPSAHTPSYTHTDGATDWALSCRVAQYSLPAIIAACYRNYMYTLFAEDWDVMIHKHVAQQQQQQQSQVQVQSQRAQDVARRRVSDDASSAVSALSHLSTSHGAVQPQDTEGHTRPPHTRCAHTIPPLLDEAGVSDSDVDDGRLLHQARLALRRSVGVLRDRDTFTYWLLSCLTADATLTGPNNMVGKSRTTVKDYEKYWLPSRSVGGAAGGGGGGYVPSINGNSRAVFARSAAASYGLPYLVALSPVRFQYRENNDPNTIQSGVIDLVVYDVTNEKVLLMVQTGGEGERRTPSWGDGRGVNTNNNNNNNNNNNMLVNRVCRDKWGPRRTRATAFLTAQEERYRFAAVVRSAITDDNAYHGFTCQGKVAEYFFDPEFGPEENFHCVMAPLRVSQRTAAEVNIPVTAFRDFTRCPPRYYIFAGSVVLTGSGSSEEQQQQSASSPQSASQRGGRADDDATDTGHKDSSDDSISRVRDTSDDSRSSEECAAAHRSRTHTNTSVGEQSSCSVNFGHVELQELAMDLSSVIPDSFTETVVLPQLHTGNEAEHARGKKKDEEESLCAMHRRNSVGGAGVGVSRASHVHMPHVAEKSAYTRRRSCSPSLSSAQAAAAATARRSVCTLASTRSLRCDREDGSEAAVVVSGDALEQVRSLLLQHAHRWPVPSFVVRRTRVVAQNASLRVMLEALRESAQAHTDSGAGGEEKGGVSAAHDRMSLTPHTVFRELLSRRHGVSLPARSPRMRSSVMSNNSSYASRS